MNAYAKLEERFSRLSDLNGAIGILDWDSATMMPTGSGNVRGQQLATLGLIRQELLTDPAVSDWIEAAGSEKLDDWQAANLRQMHRHLGEAKALPPKLIEAATKAANETELVWRKARETGDFASVRSHLDNLLSLIREAAAARSAYWNLPPYEAQLDMYQEGLRTTGINPVFDRLEQILPGMVDQAIERQARGAKPAALPSDIDVTRQMEFCKLLAGRAGFDFTIGRVDISTHPFSGGCHGDVRMTTRFTDPDMLQPITAMMHESGHAVYDMGLPKAWQRQPVGDASGMAIHESQSLLYEKQAGMSAPFIKYLVKAGPEVFGAMNGPWDFETLNAHLLHIERSCIRTAADELTYPLHVIMRYRLEQALLSGDLPVADLPGAWNEAMKTMLGIVPPNDAQGCLQDPHWFSGAIGYFPTYTLGAVLSAQLFGAAKAVHPGIDAQLEEGDFTDLRGWLGRNVHSLGCLYDAPTLIMRATGKPLDTQDFEAHLTRRYLDA